MSERIIDCDALTMYEQDQSKYSIVVDRRRALPAVQDGLKPVQRRVIYGAYKKHLTSPNNVDKSAALTGDVMGKYHPHGDCLGSDTVVYLLNGTYTTLGDLTNSGCESVEILTIDPASLKIIPAVAHSFRIGQYTDSIYHIRFSNGYEIKCTNNHPFMLPNGSFIKAENMHPYMRILTKNINFNNPERPAIDNNLIQNIVSDYYNGAINENQVRHHKDFNSLNNTKDNIEILSREDHVIAHRENNEYKNIYDDGLTKGRESMFSENGKHRFETERKNSILSKLYNEDQGIRRFKYAIEILKSKGVELTEENYESLRGELYNLPKIHNLINNHPEYNCSSFEDLLILDIPSIGEKYDEFMSNIIEPVKFDKDFNKNNYSISGNQLLAPAAINKINNMIDSGVELSIENYKSFSLTKISDEDISKILEYYKFRFPYIVDIVIEKVNNTPMYDFTVDGTENMMIPIGSTLNSPFSNELGNIVPMISAHNSSIYETIVTLVDWFKTKYPLMYGQGGWGDVTGAGAAAMRYTETALSKFGYDILIDELDDSENIVDYVETYKRNEDREPEYLSAKLPLLLINGSFGIGVGMIINVPSHNLGEVVDETLKLIENPNYDPVLIPDLPQACDFIDTNWKEISNTGRGSVKVRGRIVTETDKKGNVTLHVISLPNTVTTTNVTEKIMDMLANKQLPMVKNVINTMDDDEHPDIHIYLKPGADVNYVKQILYAKTGVQDTMSINFQAVAMNGIDIDRFSYKNYLLGFIDMRMNTKFRLYCNKLQQVLTKHHIRDAYVKVLESGEIDTIIKMIRKSKMTQDDEVIEYMIKKCHITDVQAKFIVGCNLTKLSMGYLQKYKIERDELAQKRDQYYKMVTDDGTLIKKELVQELKELKAKYNTPRLCRVIDTAHENDIPHGIFKIVITENNYIRKIPDTDRIGIVNKDNPKFVIKVDNAENILLFDNKGKVFKLPVHTIPISDRTSRGTDIRILIKNLTADVISVFYEPIFKEISKSENKHYLVILTESNAIKKLDIEDFTSIGPSGLMYSKVKPEDKVVGITLVPHNYDIAICSNKKVLRCNLKDVPLNKRNAIGVMAMNTNNPISGMSVLYPNATDIVVITRNGKINRFPITMMETHRRPGAGIQAIDLDKDDKILNVYSVNETDTIRLLATDAVHDIKVSELKSKSRIVKGEKKIPNNALIVRADIVR